ncbi:MAG: DUF4368 domain-containing protein [Ruminococcus sp.]|nr:DUF4368 domain-containing protein [Ruminococcus sp.]
MIVIYCRCKAMRVRCPKGENLCRNTQHYIADSRWMTAASAESDATDKFVDLIKKYTVIDQLDAAILNELIDKIVVHHKEAAEDGRVFQQVEIYYRLI